ncbi:MAG: SapC family protein [Pseudohongiellaceae bacterium]
MAETSAQNETPSSFSRFLWEKPELLTPEEHGKLGITPTDSRFSFTADTRGIPLTMVEFRSAQRDYPIVFSSDKEPVPIAAVGLEGSGNLFLEAEGRWAPDVYVPAYIRAHPFALAKAGNDRYAVVIDRAAPVVSENPRTPFFVDGEMTDTIRQAVEFSQNYDAETERTRHFGERLRDLDLLTLQRMRRQGSEKDEVRYFAVDADRLSALPEETIATLFKEGYLAAIIAHLFSLDQWNVLLRRSGR